MLAVLTCSVKRTKSDFIVGDTVPETCSEEGAVANLGRESHQDADDAAASHLRSSAANLLLRWSPGTAARAAMLVAVIAIALFAALTLVPDLGGVQPAAASSHCQSGDIFCAEMTAGAEAEGIGYCKRCGLGEFGGMTPETFQLSGTSYRLAYLASVNDPLYTVLSVMLVTADFRPADLSLLDGLELVIDSHTLAFSDFIVDQVAPHAGDLWDPPILFELDQTYHIRIPSPPPENGEDPGNGQNPGSGAPRSESGAGQGGDPGPTTYRSDLSTFATGGSATGDGTARGLWFPVTDRDCSFVDGQHPDPQDCGLLILSESFWEHVESPTGAQAFAVYVTVDPDPMLPPLAKIREPGLWTYELSLWAVHSRTGGQPNTVSLVDYEVGDSLTVCLPMLSREYPVVSRYDASTSTWQLLMPVLGEHDAHVCSETAALSLFSMISPPPGLQ